ncbi:MAG: hypothetical protein LQ346_001293 [Caloplaca aetnensis]|nr:MAG: hypothetical protein LQ346_001293 [Caloplaca aetnensis]
MFMHNGNIGGWRHVKRSLCMGLQERWFSSVGGSTDSEWAFAVFLDALDRMGYDPDSTSLNETGFGHGVLRKAMLATIKRINMLIAEIPDKERKEKEEGLDCRSLLNFAVTDGHSVVCTRYVSSMTDEAASLYWSSGTSWQEDNSMKGRFRMERRDKGADIVLVASEPLTFERGELTSKPSKGASPLDFMAGIRKLTIGRADDWVIVPTNSTLTVHKQAVMIHPIIDQYYNPNPSNTRSTGFAVSKGLDTTEEKEGAG